MVKPKRGLLCSLAMILLAGCASNIEALRETTLSILFPNRAVTQKSLNPEFDYIRASVNGRLAFLALGARDQLQGEPVEVFFSSDRETLKLSSGRIVEYSSSGRHIKIKTEDRIGAQSELGGHRSQIFSLIRESRPEYAVSRHSVTRRLIEATPTPQNLVGIAPESLTWFEEIIEDGLFGNPRSTYAIRRGVNTFEVVYSEQCIAPDLCFILQLWGPNGPR